MVMTKSKHAPVGAAWTIHQKGASGGLLKSKTSSRPFVCRLSCPLKTAINQRNRKHEVMRTSLSIIQTTAAFLALATSAMCAASWDISAGYSATSNPNGPWSYGRKWTVQAAAMDVFTVPSWWFGNYG